MSAVFITHNLAIVADIADDVLVLYGGYCVEQARADELFARPLHPYTQGLLHSLVSLKRKDEHLPAIEGLSARPGHAQRRLSVCAALSPRVGKMPRAAAAAF